MVIAWKNRSDIKDKRVVVMDRTGLVGTAVIEALRKQNDLELANKTSSILQVISRYQFENLAPDTGDPAIQRLRLSDQVRRRELFAFVEIGVEALEPNHSAARDTASNGIDWYSIEWDFRLKDPWIDAAINDGLRQVRLTRFGIDPGHFGYLVTTVSVQRKNLVSRDEKTGRIVEMRKKGEFDYFVPITVVMLLVMIVMLTSTTILPAIAEDKMQRVFEMLLVSATPFELIAGKVLAAAGRSLTSAAVYIAATILLLNGLAMIGLAPLKLLPWFLFYTLSQVTILCALAAAFGAACSSPQDASNFAIFLILPMMIPFFFIIPIMDQPNGALAIAMSMFPPFTPTLMLVRQLSPEGIPAWQPWVSLAGVVITIIATSWLASRIFRVGILLQGKRPKLSDLVRWGIKG